MSTVPRPWTAPLLAPAGLLYRAGTGLRNLLYDQGLLRIEPSGIGVVSVGNLAVGGSGKSPLARWIAGFLAREHPELGVALVSRGYGRRSRGLRVVADRERVLLGPEEGGDEPVMHARTLPGVPVVVAERRVEGVRHAARELGAKAAVLDDAFQHRRIARDLDIVLLDVSLPRWMQRPLPWGRAREPMRALGRAHHVVLTGRASAERCEEAAREVRKVSEAAISTGGLRPAGLVPLAGGEELAPEWLAGRRIAAGAAIARPARFVAALEGLGAEVVFRQFAPDHAPWGPRRRGALLRSAERAGAEAVVVTEKDAVKWPAQEARPPVLALRAEWFWRENGEALPRSLAWLAETAPRRFRLHV